MRSPREASGPGGGQPERRLALSGLVSRTLLTVAERERQRARLIAFLILAQAALTLAVGVGYLASPLVVGVIALSLVVYLLSLALGVFFNNANLAAYLLVFGGSVAIAAQELVFAFAHNPAGVAQSSLLFLAILLETGVLFAPEVTLLLAASTTILTAFAILLALALQQTPRWQDAYLDMVYSVGLQTLIGLVAWLLAQFIFESAVESQRAQEAEYAQAVLGARNALDSEQRLRLEESVAELQATITRALTGDYATRVDLPDGELAPLANSLNLLLERVEGATQAEQMQARIEAAALPLIDAMSRMSEAGTPTPASLPIMTNTPLDTISVALSQMQANMTSRLARVQRLVGEVTSALTHSHDGLKGATEAVQEAQRLGGALIAITEQAAQNARLQLTLIRQARRSLAGALPAEATRGVALAQEDIHRDATGLDPREAAALLGLGPDLGIAAGYTGEFNALRPTDEADAADIVPLTIPLSPSEWTALTGATGGKERASDASQEAGATGERPDELMEAWRALQRLDELAEQQERAFSQLARDLGVLSRNVRAADANIAWFYGALDAVRSNAEKLQQAARPNVAPPGIADLAQGPTSHPLNMPSSSTSGPLRQPQRTRPISGKVRLPDETPAPEGATPPPPAPGSLRAADLLSFGESNPSMANVPATPQQPAEGPAEGRNG